MIILINASNLKKGGSLQAAHSLLYEIINNKEHVFHIVLSTDLEKQIDKKSYPEFFFFYTYSIKPNIFKAIIGKDKFLDLLEKTIVPDCVFSIFGPAYWSPKSPHVEGFADGWCYNPESVVFKKLSVFNKVKRRVLIWVKNYRIKKEQQALIVETQDAKDKIVALLKISPEKIFVIGNTFNNVYNLPHFTPYDIGPRKDQEFRMITISANYMHKNLNIINSIIPILKGKEISFRFFITIDQSSFNKLFSGQEEFVTNLGPIDVKYGPSIYQQCDALFLPTLLETFTASYPEAMKMGKPILTSDLSFAHDICGDAAEYFDPLNPIDIVNKIEKIISNFERRNYLIEQGKKRLEMFENSISKAEKYLMICKQIANN